jgi:3-hydroxyisobutyrate dehydrogenase-like beta-hydroxyacid dehydrogenase
MSTVGDTVGFIGLGAMGSHLAEALVDAGHLLAVYDTDAVRMQPLIDRGAVGCASPAEVGARAATVMVSLPAPAVVREVVSSEDGLLHGDAMQTFIDLSTTGVGVAGELAATLSAREVAYLDAPVSGGVAGAKARTLAVFVSAQPAVFARHRSLLEAFSGTIVVVGDEPGQGQLAKLLNNVLSATAMAITAEAMTIGTRGGLDPEALLEALNSGTGRNSATAVKFPAHVITRRFASGFRIELMLKDLRLALAAAAAQGVPMLLANTVEQLWTLGTVTAGEGADQTELVRLFEVWAGVEVAAGGC